MGDLFYNDNLPLEVIQFDVPDADLLYFPSFLDQSEASSLFQIFLQNIQWQEFSIKMFGKSLLQPRLTAWYANEGVVYSYSGIRLLPLPWTTELSHLKTRIQHISHENFNSVLLNLYRNGQDSMGWHADDETELGVNPCIASVTLGQSRMFHIKHKYRKDIKPIHIPLAHGSLLIMRGATQYFWLHQVPKSSKPMAERINLTFRYIYQ